jgi:hypothetical protein
LKPVLREPDFAEFNLDRAFKLVVEMASRALSGYGHQPSVQSRSLRTFWPKVHRFFSRLARSSILFRSLSAQSDSTATPAGLAANRVNRVISQQFIREVGVIAQNL